MISEYDWTIFKVESNFEEVQHVCESPAFENNDDIQEDSEEIKAEAVKEWTMANLDNKNYFMVHQII